MRMVDLIQKKRNGHAFTKEEIEFMISGYTKGIIPDYQMSALTMAIYFQGMNDEETAYLTEAMVHSGEQIDLTSIHGIKVDKHSTGGVGDTTTLVLAPLVASAGVPIAKMSGRGLGHTGGTIDKLESFKGFHVELSREEFIQQVNSIGLAVIGQSGNLTPADKKLYALRDVTATVDSIPLIASSIMSKKLAAGADAIVLDVKVGSGAFMEKENDARALAEAMVRIGKHTGRKTIAIISDMNQPLGHAVGNVLEVREAIDTLKGEGPKDLEELCLVIGSHMLVLGNKANTTEEGYQILKENLKNGKALEKLRQFVQAQHGDPSFVDHPDQLPKATHQIPLLSDIDGYISAMECDSIGTAAMLLGAGRATKEASIDLAVGLYVHKKIGESVTKGEPLATIHANSLDNIEEVKKKLKAAIIIDSNPVEPPPLIHTIIE